MAQRHFNIAHILVLKGGYNELHPMLLTSRERQETCRIARYTHTCQTMRQTIFSAPRGKNQSLGHSKQMFYMCGLHLLTTWYESAAAVQIRRHHLYSDASHD